MYCKNCGKELPENARFCDRCNMSVRKKELKMDIIEELKEERLARHKAHTIEDRLKQIKKIKRKRYRFGIGLAIAIVVVGGVSILGSYLWNRSEESPYNKVEEFRESEPPSMTEAQTGNVNSDGYVEADIPDVKFAYPDGFSKNSSGKYLLSLADKSGDGTIVVGTQKAEIGAVELMEQYRDSIKNAKVENSLASAKGYSITVHSDDTTYHRKSYIEDGKELFYEMTYPTNSEKSSEYKKYAEYMDEYFKAS